MEKAEATAQLVKEEINSSLFIKESLKKGLINYSKLAKKILPKVKLQNKKANFQSVLIAIQRYYDCLNKSEKEFEKSLASALPNLELIIKNKIITLSLERNKKTMDELNEISKKIRWDAGDIMFFIQGTSEVTVILDKKNLNKFEKIKSEVIEKQDNLATISVREPEGEKYSKEIVGFLALLTSTLADNNINIYEVATTFKQEIFVIHEKDLTKSYEAFNKLISKI
jgi:hypothetical protein